MWAVSRFTSSGVGMLFGVVILTFYGMVLRLSSSYSVFGVSYPINGFDTHEGGNVVLVWQFAGE